MNTFSLVNALVLTIPFGVLGSFSSSFWEDYQAQLNQYHCGDMFLENYRFFVNANINIIYAAVGALVVAVFYYIFRPDSPDKPNLEQTQIFQVLEKILDENRHMKYLLEASLLGDGDDKRKGLLKMAHMEDDVEESTRGSVSKRKSVIERQKLADIAHEKVVSEMEENSKDFQSWWKRGRLVVFFLFTLTTISVWNLFYEIWMILTIYSVPINESCPAVGTVYDTWVTSRMEIALCAICAIFFVSIYLLV